MWLCPTSRSACALLMMLILRVVHVKLSLTVSLRGSRDRSKGCRTPSRSKNPILALLSDIGSCVGQLWLRLRLCRYGLLGRLDGGLLTVTSVRHAQSWTSCPLAELERESRYVMAWSCWTCFALAKLEDPKITVI